MTSLTTKDIKALPHKVQVHINGLVSGNGILQKRADIAERQVRDLNHELSLARAKIAELESRGEIRNEK
jgi:hypothetical protein